MRGLLLLTAIIFCQAAEAQEGILGRWVTIDDNTGRQRSIVELTERNGMVYGRVTQSFPEPGDELDPVCDECDEEDDRYNRKVIGMEIIRDMVRDGEEWKDGTILDPESGDVYDCKLWLEGGKLMVRGYLLFFFRTQAWIRERPAQQSKY